MKGLLGRKYPRQSKNLCPTYELLQRGYLAPMVLLQLMPV